MLQRHRFQRPLLHLQQASLGRQRNRAEQVGQSHPRQPSLSHSGTADEHMFASRAPVSDNRFPDRCLANADLAGQDDCG
jgi:hypothetical protein